MIDLINSKTDARILIYYLFRICTSTSINIVTKNTLLIIQTSCIGYTPMQFYIISLILMRNIDKFCFLF